MLKLKIDGTYIYADYSYSENNPENSHVTKDRIPSVVNSGATEDSNPSLTNYNATEDGSPNLANNNATEHNSPRKP